MPRPKTVLDLIDSLEPAVRGAFLASIQNITSDVQMQLLEEAIRAGNVEAAMRVLNIDASYFQPLDDALRAAHIAGGNWVIDGAKAAGKRQGVTVVGRYDARNPRAERLLRTWSSDRVVEITDSTRQAVRETLTESITAGASPRRAALDLVGRAGPGGVRSGGTIGLDSSKAEFVRNMGEDLRTLDPRYFDRKLRDKRFDPLVRRAMKAGKPVAEADIDRITARYAGRLLRLRGETIARTEMLGSIHAAQDEGLAQMVESGQIAEEGITEEWDASEDAATRKTHAAADGQTRRRGETFDIGGYPMRYPGDQERAPAKETANCRCYLRVRMDFTKGLRDRLTPEELAEVRALM